MYDSIVLQVNKEISKTQEPRRRSVSNITDLSAIE